MSYHFPYLHRLPAPNSRTEILIQCKCGAAMCETTGPNPNDAELEATEDRVMVRYKQHSRNQTHSKGTAGP